MLLTLACILACCSSGPSFEDFEMAVSSWAGTTALNCGEGLLRDESRSTALACAQRAIDEGRPFFVTIQVQGIDSTLFQGLASRGRRDSRLFWYDSDIYGGGGLGGESRLEDRSCTDPVVTTKELPLECQ
jgi:hypothetical protein